MILRIIFIIGLIFLEFNSALVYRFGVEQIIGISISDIKESFNVSLSTNTTFDLVEVIIPTVTNVTRLKQEIEIIKSLNLDYLIGTYSLTATQITTNLNIPYLIIDEINRNTQLTNSMFYRYGIANLVTPAITAFLNEKNVKSIIYFDKDPPETIDNLVGLRKFKETTKIIKSSTDFAKLFADLQLQLPNNNVFIFSVRLNNTALIQNILDKAEIRGLLNPQKLILFNILASSQVSHPIFTNYKCSSGQIYSFLLSAKALSNLQSARSFQLSVIGDLILISLRSVEKYVNAKPNNLIELLKGFNTNNGQLNDNYGFDANGKFVISDILITKMNAENGPKVEQKFKEKLTEVLDPNFVKPLNTTKVRIGVILSTGYFMNKNGASNYYGYSIDLLKEIRKLSNFQYEFVFPKQPVTGESYNGGNYTGIVKMLVDNTADMSILPMVTQYIQPAVEISDAITTMQVSMIAATTNEVLSFSAILLPFSYNAWVCIFVMFVIMGFAFWIVRALSYIPNYKKKKIPPQIGEQSFLVIYSSFVMAKLKVELNLLSLQILAFLLWFSTLTLVITYASNLLPFLIKPEIEYPFKRLSDLVSNPAIDFQLVFVKDSIDIDLLKRDENGAIVLNRTVKYVSDSETSTVIDQSKQLLIQNNHKNGYLYNLQCNNSLFIGVDQTYPMSIIMRKGWKQNAEMKKIISTLISRNIPNTLQRLYFGNGKCARNSPIAASPQVLGLGKMVSLFLLPLTGIVFGLLYVFSVYFFNKLRVYQKNKSRLIFEYGDSYEGTINSVESGGIWVFFRSRRRPYFIHVSCLFPDMSNLRNPIEEGLSSGDTIYLKYFGKDPISNEKRFCRDFDNEYESHV